MATLIAPQIVQSKKSVSEDFKGLGQETQNVTKAKSNENKYVGKHPKFNQQLFNKYDIPARKKIKDQLGDFVEENPDIYKQDFVITDPTCKYKFIEVQVCPSWKNGIYPYKRPFIHARKSVYGDDTLFITLNYEMDQVFMFCSKSAINCKPRRMKKWSREYVYDVEWCQTIKTILKNITPDLIEIY